MKKPLYKLLIIFVLMGFQLSCAGSGDTWDDDDNAIRMQLFVEDISAYARSVKNKNGDPVNPNFIIIPQNGAELAYNDTEQSEGLRTSYVDAIDGIGIEELFYFEKLDIDQERLAMLRELKGKTKIMVSDFVSDNNNISHALKLNHDEGFIAFPRAKDNYNYEYIPSSLIPNENANDIGSLSEAQNYLYFIGPNPDKYPTKEQMIAAIKLTNYDVVLIDLFSYENAFTEPEIQQLKTKANNGKRLVISYISVGSAEKYRYYWQKGWRRGSPSWIKKNYSGYPDEFWVEFWNQEWQNIIYDYIDKIIDAGFDGAYLDNVEAYYFLENN